MTWADRLILMPVSFLTSEWSQSTGLLVYSCCVHDLPEQKGILTKALEYKGVNSANFNFVTGSYLLYTYIYEPDLV